MDKVEKVLNVTEKALDLVNEVYDDTLKKPLTKVSDGLAYCMEFFSASIHPTMYEYIENAKYKMKEVDKKLEKKYKEIPEDKKTKPRINILGPTTDLLKYNLEENHIKDIIVNLLASEMNIDSQNKVLPAFIEIARQLSSLDAQILKSLYDAKVKTKYNSFAIDTILLETPFQKNAYVELDRVIVVSYENKILHTIKPSRIVLDNLSRLELIRIEDGKEIAASQLYGKGFNLEKHKYEKSPGNLTFSKGIFRITDFGVSFLDICFK